MLPSEPIDNQILIDSLGIKWIFSLNQNCWICQGKIKTLPIANATTIGLLSDKLKYFLDTIPEKGGGYAIITKPLNRRTIENPDGILFGNIELVSDSLQIDCVNADGSIISNPKSCNVGKLFETDQIPPGFDFNFSDDFLNSLCVEIPGGPGPKGVPGDKGPAGKDGTGDGPQGVPGDSGENIIQSWPIIGVRITDVDETTDTAIIKLDINKAEGKIFTTKGKITLPIDADTPVEQFIVRRLNKPIKFLNCFEYKIQPDIPCKPGETEQDRLNVLNPTVAFYPEYFDPDIKDRTYEPVKARFSNIIDNICEFYQGKLNEAAIQWDQQIEDYLRSKDTAGREALDEVAKKLAECESIRQLDVCVGVNEDCKGNELSDVAGGPLKGSGTSPTGQVDYFGLAPIPEILGLDPLKTQVISLGMAEIIASNPIFSFRSTSPPAFPKLAGGTLEDKICDNAGGCWIQYPNGVAVFLPYGLLIPKGSILCALPRTITDACDEIPPHLKTQIIPDPNDPIQKALIEELEQRAEASTGEEKEAILQEIENIKKGYPSSETLAAIYQDWINGLTTNLNNSFVLYKKFKLRYSPELIEFPAGIYLFLYRDGAIKQTELNDKERYGIPASNNRFIKGPFLEYFVGNEGNGKSLVPFTIINPYDRTTKTDITGAIASTEIGLEIGWTPIDYVDFVPFDYYSKHAFNPANIQGNAGVHLPLSHVDYNGLALDVLTMESKITWQKMSSVGVGDDITRLRLAYYARPLQDRAILFETTESGFFFARIKTAYSATNIFGGLVMPPINDHKYSSNVALIHTKDQHPLKVPAIDARPTGIGSVKVQVIRLITPPGEHPHFPSEGTLSSAGGSDCKYHYNPYNDGPEFGGTTLQFSSTIYSGNIPNGITGGGNCPNVMPPHPAELTLLISPANLPPGNLGKIKAFSAIDIIDLIYPVSGDLQAVLTSSSSGKTVTILYRPGSVHCAAGNPNPFNGTYSFRECVGDDSFIGKLPAMDQINKSTYIRSPGDWPGSQFATIGNFDDFIGESILGIWTLRLYSWAKLTPDKIFSVKQFKIWVVL